MNKTKVELPDGRLLVIEGGDAAGTANLLLNHYLGQAGAPIPNRAEEALEMPTLTFTQRTENKRWSDAPVVSIPAPVSNADEALPLPIPVMQF